MSPAPYNSAPNPEYIREYLGHAVPYRFCTRSYPFGDRRRGGGVRNLFVAPCVRATCSSEFHNKYTQWCRYTERGDVCQADARVLAYKHYFQLVFPVKGGDNM